MQIGTRRFLKYRAPLYIYAGIIFYMSSLPQPLPAIPILSFDKVLHIIEYAVFGLLAVRAFKYSTQKMFYESFKILALLLTILYGVSDEVHQLFVPSRQFSVFDIAADTIGGMLGVLLYGRYHTF